MIGNIEINQNDILDYKLQESWKFVVVVSQKVFEIHFEVIISRSTKQD